MAVIVSSDDFARLRREARDVRVADRTIDAVSALTVREALRFFTDLQLSEKESAVAEKVLRGSANPLLLVRATEDALAEGEDALKSVIVPLDGSELAESVLPMVAEVAKKLDLEVCLSRAYHIPYNLYAADDGSYLVNYDELIAGVRDEANEYLEKKAGDLKKLGVVKISTLTKEGFAGDEIIVAGRNAPASLIAMCSHGRSGVKRWVLGSVTETVVRHAAGPVLVARAR